jgi:hypothetical protein
MDAKASGMSSLAGLTLARRARPMTMGRKNAVAAVLLMKDPTAMAATMITSSSWLKGRTERRRKVCTTHSVTPVRSRAVIRISSPSIITTTSLPKPANALSAGSRPLRVRNSSRPSAVASVGQRSRAKRTATTRIVPSVRRMGALIALAYRDPVQEKGEQGGGSGQDSVVGNP